ncbi:MAG TPA: hypothetical protein VIK86_02790 [Candidatus Paceibacterota bacterium]
MVNQDLIDFIKKELQKGINKEVISKELFVGDWTLEDIEEGFKSIDILREIPAPKPTPVYSSIATPIPTLVSDIKPEQSPAPEIDPNFKPIKTFTSSFSSDFHKTSNKIISSTDNKGHTIRNVILTVLGLLLLAGGAFAFVFRNDLPIIKDLVNNKNVTANDINQEQNIQPQNQNTEVSTQVQPTQPDQNKVTVVDETAQNDALFANMNNAVIDNSKTLPMDVKPIDCGKDMICLINNVKNCFPSFIENTVTVNVLGMFNQTNKQKISLTGYDSSKKCGYTSYVVDVVSLEYTPEMQNFIKTEIKKQGKILTNDQMAEALKAPATSVDSAKSTIGTSIVCSFTTSYLTELLTKWANGIYSGTDMDPGNCKAVDVNKKLVPILTS